MKEVTGIKPKHLGEYAKKGIFHENSDRYIPFAWFWKYLGSEWNDTLDEEWNRNINGLVSSCITGDDLLLDPAAAKLTAEDW